MKIRFCGTGSISQRTEFSSIGGMHRSCHEILYITAGRAVFKWRGNVCEADSPAVFILSASTPHELACSYDGIQFLFIEIDEWGEFPFSEEQVDQWNFKQSRKDVNIKTLEASAILQSIDFVYHLQSTGSALRDSNLTDVCLLEIHKIYRLIAHELEASKGGTLSRELKSRPKSREAVDLLIDYMDWKYKEDVSLEELAKVVYLHPSYLVRLFKKHTNMTPFEYLRDLRLKAAASYLSGSDLSIRDVVQQTGFNSVHYFTRLFTSSYGQSPAEWRKLMRRATAASKLPGETIRLRHKSRP
ncbi:AraC family transcriptional regulator [Paenibacillus sp. J5C_2022]|uniref:AraC family transcriptional regulator n=1 Tax=Paenibacillus sp. J5C2022 TaxID=2977129 RepID=UPI0021D219CB|nr:AraC family transcriptional regulator [Paenibacillus sp. J5C2022]MCU6709944.1 AraC family transcriptional regulator [Paenibacillus sp. J5C2022]